MNYLKLNLSTLLKLILLFFGFIVLYYSIQYKPITFPTLKSSTTDSPYLTPEGWPLPYPYVTPSFK